MKIYRLLYGEGQVCTSTAKQSVFSSKSVKESVKRGVRVLRASLTRPWGFLLAVGDLGTRLACEAREKKPFV